MSKFLEVPSDGRGTPHFDYRIRAGVVQRREALHPWAPLTKAEKLALPVDGVVWDWLRENGITRPSPSGRSATNAERAASGKVRVEVWLSGPAAESLDELAAESSRRQVIEDLLLSQRRRR